MRLCYRIKGLITHNSINKYCAKFTFSLCWTKITFILFTLNTPAVLHNHRWNTYSRQDYFNNGSIGVLVFNQLFCWFWLFEWASETSNPNLGRVRYNGILTALTRFKRMAILQIWRSILLISPNKIWLKLDSFAIFIYFNTHMITKLWPIKYCNNLMYL